MQDKEKIVNDSIDIGGSLVGSAAGAAIGAVSGPAGSVLGALAGTAIEKILVFIGSEIKERKLSKNESKRIGTVYEIAIERIQKNRDSGKRLRDDDFFESKDDERSAGEEILEGVLLAAEREYEERKLKYLGYLYANLAFDKNISRSIANALIKTASELTYRQLAIIKAVGVFQLAGKNSPARTKAYTSVSGLNEVSVASDIYSLYNKSILHSASAILDAGGITPSLLTLIGHGALLFGLMELQTMPIDEIYAEVVKFLTDKNVKLVKDISGNDKLSIF